MSRQPLPVRPAARAVQSRCTAAAADAALSRLMTAARVFETPARLAHREAMLLELRSLVRAWISAACASKGIPAHRGLLRTFGSYRLGVHASDADIDAVAIGPSAVGRDAFFADFAARLRAHPSASCVRCIPDAFMPLIKCQLGGVDVDLLYAAVPAHVLPVDAAPDVHEGSSSSISSSSSSSDFSSTCAHSNLTASTNATSSSASFFSGTSGGDPCALLLDDAALQSLDAQTCRALNGPRVNETILALVPDMHVFQTALRCVKLWARRRGIYSNILGFLGGVSWAILVARVCQIHARQSVSSTVKRFFEFLSACSWTQPVSLETAHALPAPPPSYLPPSAMRVMTPTHPVANTTFNVSPVTLRIVCAEAARAAEIMASLSLDPADAMSSSASVDGSMGALGDEDSAHAIWSELCAPSSFFSAHKSYVQINIGSTSADQHAVWFGWVESRLRKLYEFLEHVPGVRAYPLPIAFDNARLVNCSFAAPSSSSSSSSTSASVANPSAPNIVACASFFLAVEHSSGNGSISASIPNLSAALARFGAYAHEGLLRFTPGRIETVLVRQNRLPEAARAWASAQVAVSGADGHVGSTAGTGVGACADVGSAAGATTQHRRRRNRERHADANANATLNGASITASEHATAGTAHDGSSAHESHANINARTAALDCSPHLTAMGGAQICSTPLAPLLHLSASAISSSSTIPSSAAASSLTTGLSPYVNLMSLERPSNGARSSIGASGVGRGMSMPGTPRDTIAAATHSHGHAHQTAPLSSSKKRKARPTEVQMLQSQSPLSGGAESVSLSGVGANSSSSSSASLDLAQPSARSGGSFHGVGARSANAYLRASLAKHAHHTANSAAAMAGESYVDEAANAQRKMARPKKSPKISPDSQ